MRINHNIAALNTYRQLTANNAAGSKSLEKLSSGYRINRAGDDAAGLAISEKMRAQIRGLGTASRNSQDAISLIQTAEGALSETHSILQRMRELGVQASNDTNVSVDRKQIQKELDQLTSEINRIGEATEFNTMKLLNGDRKNVYTTTVNTITTTVAGSTKVNSGTLTISPKLAYVLTTNSTLTAGGTFSDKINGGSITVAAGEFKNAIASSSVATLTITRTNSTSMTVKLDAPGTAGTTIKFSAIDTINADTNGDYIYNDHGVTFTIKKADWAKISNAASLKISSYSGNGSITFVADVHKDTQSTGTTISNFKIAASSTANADLQKARRVSVEHTSGLVTVKIYSGSGTTALFTDHYNISGSKTINYSNHGLSFDVAVGSASAAASFSATKSFDTKLTVVTAVTTKVVSSTTTLTKNNALKFQVGANENQSLTLEIASMMSINLKLSATSGGSGFVTAASTTNGKTSVLNEFSLDVSSSFSAAASAVSKINDAIGTVSEERAKLGSVQNRLEHTISNLDTAAENLQASESRIRDVDMAKEMMEFTKNNILMQAAQSMLAQANQQPQGVLQLLR